MLNILGTILIITVIALSALSFLRPKIFKRQDIVLIVVFVICGIILFSEGTIYDRLPQIILMLLTATAVSYTVDSLRLRNSKKN